MATSTSVNTSVSAHVTARSTTWVANEILRTFLEIVQTRGLEIHDLHEQLDFYEKSLRTWLTGRHLLSVVLEVWNPQTEEQAAERYDLNLDYSPDGDNGERFETHLDRVRDELPRRPLPAGFCYRLLVTLSENAPDLPGWEDTEFRDVSHLQIRRLDNVIETAAINASGTAYLSPPN